MTGYKTRRWLEASNLRHQEKSSLSGAYSVKSGIPLYDHHNSRLAGFDRLHEWIDQYYEMDDPRAKCCLPDAPTGATAVVVGGQTLGYTGTQSSGVANTWNTPNAWLINYPRPFSTAGNQRLVTQYKPVANNGQPEQLSNVAFYSSSGGGTIDVTDQVVQQSRVTGFRIRLRVVSRPDATEGCLYFARLDRHAYNITNGLPTFSNLFSTNNPRLGAAGGVNDTAFAERLSTGVITMSSLCQKGEIEFYFGPDCDEDLVFQQYRKPLATYGLEYPELVLANQERPCFLIFSDSSTVENKIQIEVEAMYEIIPLFIAGTSGVTTTTIVNSYTTTVDDTKMKIDPAVHVTFHKTHAAQHNAAGIANQVKASSSKSGTALHKSAAHDIVDQHKSEAEIIARAAKRAYNKNVGPGLGGKIEGFAAGLTAAVSKAVLDATGGARNSSGYIFTPKSKRKLPLSRRPLKISFPGKGKKKTAKYSKGRKMSS